jgi:hypothetical protein
VNKVHQPSKASNWGGNVPPYPLPLSLSGLWEFDVQGKLKTSTEDFRANLNNYFESNVEIPRMKVGEGQTIETLINEEALLFAQYLVWHAFNLYCLTANYIICKAMVTLRIKRAIVVTLKKPAL